MKLDVSGHPQAFGGIGGRRATLGARQFELVVGEIIAAQACSTQTFLRKKIMILPPDAYNSAIGQ